MTTEASKIKYYQASKIAQRVAEQALGDLILSVTAVLREALERRQLEVLSIYIGEESASNLLAAKIFRSCAVEIPIHEDGSVLSVKLDQWAFSSELEMPKLPVVVPYLKEAIDRAVEVRNAYQSMKDELHSYLDSKSVKMAVKRYPELKALIYQECKITPEDKLRPEIPLSEFIKRHTSHLTAITVQKTV